MNAGKKININEVNRKNWRSLGVSNFRKILKIVIDEILPRGVRGSNENIGRNLINVQGLHSFSQGESLNSALWKLWNFKNGRYQRYLRNWNGEKIGFLLRF